MGFVKVARVEQIPVGTMKSFTVEEVPILLANVDGHFYAISNQCTHAGVGLSQGKLEGKIVTCPRQGSQFDVTSGARLKGPAWRAVTVYAVQVEGQEIKVNVEETK